VHRLLREDAEVKAAIVGRLGDDVLDEAGEIDRARVARVVFSDPEALRWLEGLLHPRVVAAYLAWREELATRSEPPAVCVTEVPLLYEVGGETRFDAVVAVTAPAALRAARIGHDPSDRERRLLREEDKVARADFAFVNDGSLADLDAFVADVMAELAGSHEKRATR
jgi:dephospho-CoA kinase